MKLRNLLLLAVMIIPLSAVAFAHTSETQDVWQDVGTGIEFQQFRLINPAPVNIFVARMDRENPNAIIESSIALGRLSGGLETVSGMAERYDQALNFWGEPTIPVSQTWGSRNDVIVAINGFYYGGDVEPPGVPWSGQIHSGWYAKRFDDKQSSSGFIWKMDRSAFIGGCIYHPDNKQYVYDLDTSSQILIDGLNRIRSDDELILYTSQYDRDTNTEGTGTEVVVEMTSPSYTSVFANMPYGIVRKVRQNKGSTPIPFDHVVLSGHGTKAQALISYLQEDDIVRIAQRVVDCIEEPVQNIWDLSYSGVGGHWRFLRDGIIYDYDDDGQAKVPDPRTAIAYNKEYIYFIVADGRDPGVSEGMKVVEMAEFAKNTLGATDGIMQDGGGSSTMVINGIVVNNTFCNNVYCTDKVFLPLIINTSESANPSSNQLPGAEPIMEWANNANALQRLVANGMMMVVVDPMERSTQPFDPGDPITTFGSLDAYLGPGNNYAVLDPASGDGTISNPINNLGGVLAKGSYWWKVKIGTTEGWVSETDIEAALKYRSSTEFKPR